MKRLVLIKQSSAIQLGHLYEHIFCMHIERLFRQKKLYPLVDYSLTGKTYYGGIIMIDLELYTPTAERVAKSIAKLRIEWNEAMIQTGVLQLVAEKEAPFGIDGYGKIVDELAMLHEQAWQAIDDVESIDVKQVRRKVGPLYIIDGSLPARKLKVNIHLESEFATAHRTLLPLFRQIAKLLASSLEHQIPDQFGFFSEETMFTSGAKATYLTSIFKVARAADTTVDVTAVLAACEGIVADLRKHGVIERYMRELRRTSYYGAPNLAPSLEATYEDTLLMLGAKGWKRLATTENCQDIVKYMSIEVTQGRNTARRRIA